MDYLLDWSAQAKIAQIDLQPNTNEKDNEVGLIESGGNQLLQVEVDLALPDPVFLEIGNQVCQLDVEFSHINSLNFELIFSSPCSIIGLMAWLEAPPFLLLYSRSRRTLALAYSYV